MHMTDELTTARLLEPSAVLSRALDFMETDLDADAYSVISAWITRAIREIREDLARAQAIDPEALEGLPAARMKIEGGKLWLRIFEEIQGAITRYGSGWEA
jgi:transcription elongation GreA/GreB family factor